MRPIGEILISLGAVTADAESMVNEFVALNDAHERSTDERAEADYARMGLLALKAIKRCHQYEREGSPHAASSESRRGGGPAPGNGFHPAPSLI